MPVYHTVTMSNDATTNKFLSTPAGTLATPAVLPRETYLATSALTIRMGTETPNVVFAGAGGGTAYADMIAALGAWANGTVAHCYAANSAQHGRYVKTAGVWTRTGPVAPLYEYDNNHMKVVNDLMLLMQSFFNTGHPANADDGPGGAFVDKVAYPNVLDMTNHIMRLRMRAVDLRFPSDYKIGMHLQGELLGVPRLGSGNGGLGAFPAVNAMNHTDILGHLGSGNAGIYGDNTVNYIADSGWVDIDIPMSPSDADWTMMVGNEDKDGHQGAAYTQSLMYIGTTAKRLVGPDMQKINAYMCGFRWNPRPGQVGANTPRPRAGDEEDFEPTGSIYVEKIEFISPA